MTDAKKRTIEEPPQQRRNREREAMLARQAAAPWGVLYQANYGRMSGGTNTYGFVAGPRDGDRFGPGSVSGTVARDDSGNWTATGRYTSATAGTRARAVEALTGREVGSVLDLAPAKRNAVDRPKQDPHAYEPQDALQDLVDHLAYGGGESNDELRRHVSGVVKENDIKPLEQGVEGDDLATLRRLFVKARAELSATLPVPPVGSILENGSTVISARARRGETYVVLAICSDSASPYATWMMNQSDGGTYWGHYFGPESLKDAIEDYETR